MVIYRNALGLNSPMHFCNLPKAMPYKYYIQLSDGHCPLYSMDKFGMISLGALSARSYIVSQQYFHVCFNISEKVSSDDIVI